jgi:ferredoxin
VTARLHIDRLEGDAPIGASVFECAEALGVSVPTSCRKQGRCKECVVEVTEGMERLSAPAPAESHLKGDFRLSCCARIAAGDGDVRCHTMRRGTMRIERNAFQLPVQGRRWELDPAVTRAGS